MPESVFQLTRVPWFRSQQRSSLLDHLAPLQVNQIKIFKLSHCIIRIDASPKKFVNLIKLPICEIFPRKIKFNLCRLKVQTGMISTILMYLFRSYKLRTRLNNTF